MENLELLLSLALNIESACRAKGMTVNQALINCGLEKSFVSNIKLGRTPSVSRMATLAKFLGVSIESLIGNEVPNQTMQERALDAFLALSSDERKAFIQEAVKHI